MLQLRLVSQNVPWGQSFGVDRAGGEGPEGGGEVPEGTEGDKLAIEQNTTASDPDLGSKVAAIQ